MPTLEGHLDDITDLAQLEKLLIDLGLAQIDEAIQAALRHHLQQLVLHEADLRAWREVPLGQPPPELRAIR